MKNILILLSVLFSIHHLQAQMVIGKEEVDGAGILDFVLGENKGILLPILTELPTQPSNGTIIFNNVDGDTNKLKVMVFENNDWKSLSDEGALSIISENGENLTTPYVENRSEETGEGVILGEYDENQVANGVLVLESTDKALILPKVVDPHLQVKSPRAGTILYDLTTKSLVVFDGKVWNYWQ